MTERYGKAKIQTSHLDVCNRHADKYESANGSNFYQSDMTWSFRIYGGWYFRVGIETNTFPVEANVSLEIKPHNDTIVLKPVVIISAVHQFDEVISGSNLITNCGTVECFVKFKVISIPVFKPLSIDDFGLYADYGNELALCGSNHQINDGLKQVLKPVFEAVLTDLMASVKLDAMVTFGDQSIEVSRKLLTMISPVFRAKFAEADAVEINEVDFDAAKEVIHWCHGNEANPKSTVMIIQMIRFAYNYDIKPVIKALEPYESVFFNVESFCTMAKYAWDFDKKHLKVKCAKYYRCFVEKLTFSPEFLDLDAVLKDSIIRLAANY